MVEISFFCRSTKQGVHVRLPLEENYSSCESWATASDLKSDSPQVVWVGSADAKETRSAAAILDDIHRHLCVFREVESDLQAAKNRIVGPTAIISGGT